MYATAASTRSARRRDCRIILSSMAQMIRLANQIKAGPIRTPAVGLAGNHRVRSAAIPLMLIGSRQIESQE